jgi:ankyrin repeat protein
MPPPLSSSSLLELCDLPRLSSEDVRRTRLEILRSWASQPDDDDDDANNDARVGPSLIELLTLHNHGMDTKTGCMPLHWLAGTGFNEAIDFVMSLLLHCDRNNNSDDDDDEQKKKVRASIIDQRAHKPSTDRTPLHYAARNGHLSTCSLLIEKYGALSHPVASGGVTPLQLAVWQNRLDVVTYLVKINGINVIHERNGYDCGLAHWIGLIPKKRWSNNNNNNNDDDVDNDDDGSGVLPLAIYLHTLGISYTSIPTNCNTQGHTPAHKAAWGGNLSLLQYYRDIHGVHDTMQDVAGNYCTDIARMRKNTNCVTWLQECANGKRAESYAVLGLDGNTATVEDVRRRFIELAKVCHPDSRGGRRRRSDEEHHHQHPHQDEEHDMYDDDNDDKRKEEMTENDDDFVRIRAAYEHLTKEGGVGNQCNPKYDEVKLLEDRKRIANNDNSDDALLILSSSNHGIDVIDDNNSNNGIIDDDDDLFMARLIAVISDYDENCGFPVALIARRWNQIWADRPFPKEYVIERTVQVDDSTTTIIRKKVRLLRWLRWKRDRSKCTTVYFRNVEGVVLAFNKTRKQQGEG